MQDKTVKIIPNAIFFKSIIEILDAGKKAKFNLQGESMRPFLRQGDQVTLIKINPKKIKVGEVILARYQGNYVLHRVVRRQRELIWLAGDANVFQIEKIPINDLLATIVTINRKTKEISVNSSTQRILGMTWYFSRPLRYLSKKIFRKK